MTRILAVTVVLALAVAACGGNSGDSPAVDGNGQTSTTQGTAVGGSDQGTTTGGSAEPEGSGPSTATVTIAGETYNFASEGAYVGQCLPDLFGIFSVQLPMIGDDGSIKLVILHDDTDPADVDQVNAVSINTGDEDWFADESSEWFEMSDSLEPGMSQVDSAEIDGSTVRGTATFISEYTLYGSEVETATGTFNATCGEERGS